MESKLKIHSCLTAKKDASIVEIAKLMKKNKERRVFIVDNKEKLLGIVTNSDIVYKAVADKKTEGKAGDIMEKDVSAVDINDPLEKALGIMNKHETFVCPVADKGKLKGVFSYHEIINFILSSSKKE